MKHIIINNCSGCPNHSEHYDNKLQTYISDCEEYDVNLSEIDVEKEIHPKCELKDYVSGEQEG